MTYRIRYLPLAVKDIDSIASYLSQFYPGSASRILNTMEKKIGALQEHPFQCELYDPDPYYRRLVVSDYLVFYHVNEAGKTLDIYRVLRASWDIRSIMK